MRRYRGAQTLDEIFDNVVKARFPQRGTCFRCGRTLSKGKTMGDCCLVKTVRENPELMREVERVIMARNFRKSA